MSAATFLRQLLANEILCDGGKSIFPLALLRGQSLRFLAPRVEAAERSAALGAIAGGDDLESIAVLLASGADPLWGRAGLQSSLQVAASRGRAATVAAMLPRVKDLSDPKVAAAYRTVRAGDDATRKAFVDAGVNPPPRVSPPPPAP